jgi:RNA polymerase sigma-70 factor (ECF subfamily)
VGLVFAPGGRLARALSFTLAKGKIAEVEIITDRARLQQLNLSVLDD